MLLQAPPDLLELPLQAWVQVAILGARTAGEPVRALGVPGEQHSLHPEHIEEQPGREIGTKDQQVDGQAEATLQEPRVSAPDSPRAARPAAGSS